VLEEPGARVLDATVTTWTMSSFWTSGHPMLSLFELRCEAEGRTTWAGSLAVASVSYPGRVL